MNIIFHLYFFIYFFRYFLSYIFLDFEIEKMMIHLNNITLLLTLLHYIENILKERGNTHLFSTHEKHHFYFLGFLPTYYLRKSLNTNLSFEVSFVSKETHFTCIT
jgi:hypothetical protein